MPRVIPSQQAAGDIKKAAEGDVETMNAFTGLEMQERAMEKNSSFQRAESLGSAQSHDLFKRFVHQLVRLASSSQSIAANRRCCCFHQPAQLDNLKASSQMLYHYCCFHAFFKTCFNAIIFQLINSLALF